MKKHSITIAGHRTSITLEEPFWQELQAIAKIRHKKLAVLVTEIDATRDLTINLSSALRLFVLAEIKKGSGKSPKPFE